jgi:hypothetical protein
LGVARSFLLSAGRAREAQNAATGYKASMGRGWLVCLGLWERAEKERPELGGEAWQTERKSLACAPRRANRHQRGRE